MKGARGGGAVCDERATSKESDGDRGEKVAIPQNRVCRAGERLRDGRKRVDEAEAPEPIAVATAPPPHSHPGMLSARRAHSQAIGGVVSAREWD